MEKQHKNLELIHSFFIAYNQKDMEALEGVLDPEITWNIPGEHPLCGLKVGVEEVLGYFKEMEYYQFQAANLVLGVNDSFVVDCHQNWTDFKGERFEVMSCLLWKIKGGKIVEVYNFPGDQKAVNDFFIANRR
ncbi:nuclear transport factor 2 family protein [Algoriphagus zhangzhouensis]|uniref:SnoaL-like domain-containing protein n=1 Tax=Algoriphagus zhangzhouensis TaxID=1073327 RepID=A0A1M7ZJU6_9BACT|nr:nuclear transport factor 2 family protein [Algoriphagus zhangzhouensis]TDY43512.1 ketosteroid isomerase-like protein [Algoriphagus zhangzhouensis]SHO65082.1 SnoaL-like domain-containing protein [Algoriphagus zhangzhouensis]